MILVVAIGARIGPGLPVDGKIAHAGGGFAPTPAIDALGILAAGHLEAIGRTGEFHALYGARIDIFQCHRSPAHQIGRPWQDLKRCDAAIGHGAAEAGILRPDAMFGPYIRRRWVCRFIAVRMRLHAGAGIDAQMAVHIDNAGRHELAGAVDLDSARGRRQIAVAHRQNLAAAHHHRAVVDPRAFAVIDHDIAHDGGCRGIGAVGGGKGCLPGGQCRRLLVRLAGCAGRRSARIGASAQRDQQSCRYSRGAFHIVLNRAWWGGCRQPAVRPPRAALPDRRRRHRRAAYRDASAS